MNKSGTKSDNATESGREGENVGVEGQGTVDGGWNVAQDCVGLAGRVS